MTGSKFFARLVKKHGYYEALKLYNGTGAAAERYRKEMLETLGRAGIDIHDPLPAEHKPKPGADKLIRQEELEQAQAQKSRRLMELKATQVTPSEAAAIRSAAKKHGVPENWVHKKMSLENSGAEETALLNSPSRYDDLFKKAGAKYGIDWRIAKAIAVHESRLNPRAIGRNSNGTVDRGLMQLNSRYDAERGITDPFDVEQNIDAGTKFIADKIKKHGLLDGLKAYNGTGAAAERYGRDVYNLYRSSQIDDPLPAEHRSKTGADKLGSISINGQFTLRDSQGREVADPVAVNHRYELPHTGLA